MSLIIDSLTVHQLCLLSLLLSLIWMTAGWNGPQTAPDGRKWHHAWVSRSPDRSLWRPSAASSLKHCWPGRTTAPLTDRQVDRQVEAKRDSFIHYHQWCHCVTARRNSHQCSAFYFEKMSVFLRCPFIRIQILIHLSFAKVILWSEQDGLLELHRSNLLEQDGNSSETRSM